MNKKIQDFTIGADPEFACLNQRGRLIHAGDVVSHEEGTEFGSDGNAVTFEIRPEPSNDPLIVVNNIHDIFLRTIIEKPEFVKFKWISGTWYGSLAFGGHVHFGISNKIINHHTAVQYLDNYVGVVSLLMEIKNDGINRRRDGYGCMGDMRCQNWGFEYRSMSSWISSPYIAAAIMCLSKTVMYEVINNSKFEWHEYAVNDNFYKMEQEKILEKFPSIWDDITKMYLYQVYKPYIDLIYFLVKNNFTWFPSSGMKESWGVVNMEPCITNKIGIDLIWHRYNTEQVLQ